MGCDELNYMIPVIKEREIRLPHVSSVVLGLAIMVILGDIFMLIFGGLWSEGERHLRGLAGEKVTLSGVVVEDPDTSESKTTYRLSDLRLEGKGISGTVFVSGAINREVQRNDRVEISGKMNEGFGTFSGTFYRPTVLRIIHPETEDMFLSVRNLFSGKIRDYIPEKEAALGLGYLLGVRSSLPDGLAETLKVVGLTHIIVASGANLSILIGFSRRIFGKISRFLGMIVSLALVLFYVFMVGLSPSMVRAGIVSILSLFVWYVGRSFKPFRLLILVVAMTLIYNPMYLIDLGWLLSFGSFAGVMVVAPWLTRFFYGEKKPGIVGATLIEALGASLVCTPILVYFFGSLSLISLLANLLILPTISLAMGLCFLTGIFGFLGLVSVAGIFGQISTLLLSLHLSIIDFLGQRKEFLVTIPTGQWWVFLVYIPIAAIAIFNLLKQRKRGVGNGQAGRDIADDRSSADD